MRFRQWVERLITNIPSNELERGADSLSTYEKEKSLDQHKRPLRPVQTVSPQGRANGIARRQQFRPNPEALQSANDFLFSPSGASHWLSVK